MTCYDLAGGQSGADVFTMMTHEIAEYITRTYMGMSEFLKVMDQDTMVFEVLFDPAVTPPLNGAVFEWTTSSVRMMTGLEWMTSSVQMTMG